MNKVRKSLHSSEEPMKSLTTSNKAESSVYDEIVKDYEQSISQNLETFPRLLRGEESDVNFILQN